MYDAQSIAGAVEHYQTIAVNDAQTIGGVHNYQGVTGAVKDDDGAAAYDD